MMRNLSKTVDRILKVEPSLGDQLLPIKSKWEKSNRSVYWRQLIRILNTTITAAHPKHQEIRNIFYVQKSHVRTRYTFETPAPSETVMGVIPEDLECRLRKFDRQQIALAKKAIEAQMTHDETAINEVAKQHEKLDLKQRQVWSALKDRFKLWEINEPCSFFIRIRDSLLVLTSQKSQQHFGPVKRIPVDGDSIQRFLKMLGLSPDGPPPEGFPPSD
jgi:hypothetical protein